MESTKFIPNYNWHYNLSKILHYVFSSLLDPEISVFEPGRAEENIAEEENIKIRPKTASNIEKLWITKPVLDIPLEENLKPR